MTFLELINAVLRRLREDAVVSSNSTDYSKLIGDFVNESIRQVMDAWEWNGAKYTSNINTVAGTAAYSLNDDNVVIYSVLNATSKWRLKSVDYQWIHDQQVLAPVTGSPYMWAISGYNSASKDKAIWFYPTPTATETITLYRKFPIRIYSTDGSDDAKGTNLPDMPVILFAYAKAVSERGEDGGVSYSEADDIARKSLADHISIDSAQNSPYEINWISR